MELSKDPKASGTLICQAIEKDSRKASSLKSRVLALREMSEDADLGPLVEAIADYFLVSPRDVVSSQFESDDPNASVRQTISREISQIIHWSYGDKRMEIITVFRDRINELLSDYSRVAEEFAALRLKLLKPK
jgi:hypothetical protein